MTVTAPPAAPPGGDGGSFFGSEPSSRPAPRRGTEAAPPAASVTTSRLADLRLPVWALDAVFLGLVGAVALWGFVASFGTLGLTTGVIGMVVAGAWAFVAALKPWRLWTVVLGAIGIYLLLGGPLAVPDLTVAGFVPTPQSVWQLLGATITGWADILVTRPPIGQLGNLMAIPLLCGVLIGAVSGSVARRADRRVTLALLPPFAVLVVGVLLGTGSPVSAYQGVLFGLLAAYWAARRQTIRRLSVSSGHATGRRLVTAVLLMALAAGAGLVIGNTTFVSGSDHRVVLRNEIPPSVDTRLLTSPLAGLRHYLIDEKDQTLFTVAGAGAGTQYIRLAALDSYDGSVWRAAQSTANSDPAALFERVGQSIPVQAQGPSRTVTIALPADSPYADVWVPTIGQSASITFTGSSAQTLRNDVRYNLGLATAAVGEGVPVAMTYTLSSYGSLPIATATVPLATVSGGFPKGTTAWVAKYDKDRSGDALAQMQALADSLKANGVYSDGLTDAGQQSSLPGHGDGRLADFLSQGQPVGDAEQFAAALGLMGRSLGIADRVVVGFAHKGDGPVKGSEMTAWVEVATARGWVAVDPTPDKSKTMVVVTNQNPEPPANVTSPPPPDPPRPATPNPAAGSKAGHTTCAASGSCAHGSFLPAWVGPVVGFPLAIALFLGGIVALLVGMKAARRRRRRNDGAPSARVVAGWDELCDLVRDIGGVLPHSATRRECAVLVDQPGMAAVARNADTLVFGPAEVTDAAAEEYWSKVETTRMGILGSLTRTDRWKAMLSLSSLHPAERMERALGVATGKFRQLTGRFRK